MVLVLARDRRRRRVTGKVVIIYVFGRKQRACIRFGFLPIPQSLGLARRGPYPYA